MNRLGQSKWRHYRAYGGPEDGTIVMMPRDADWHVARASRQDVAGFVYLLVSAPEGGSVLVPRQDSELLAALRMASRSGHAPAHEALAAEVERRKLDS